jgi:hypothetical protein
VSVNEDDPEVGLHLTALNCSAKELHAKILFPLFKASEMGNLDDVWYLYLNNDAEYHLRQSNTNGENHVHDNQT